VCVSGRGRERGKKGGEKTKKSLGCVPGIQTILALIPQTYYNYLILTLS